jgi:hypothetical protein
MNNLNPGGTALQVGPGLGVCGDVPATGGYQQLFRVLPNNPNDERLIQLKGTTGGPMNPVVQGGHAISGRLTQFPEKNTMYRTGGVGAQGQGGAIICPEGRPEFTKTERSTIRSQTGVSRFEGPPQYSVNQPYVDTGIKSLPHVSGNRSNEDREGNAGRMNVQGDPLSAIGDVTNLRRELKTDAPGAPNGSRFTQYIRPMYDDLNTFKSQVNPYANKLDIAKTNTMNNPLQININ